MCRGEAQVILGDLRLTFGSWEILRMQLETPESITPQPKQTTKSGFLDLVWYVQYLIQGFLQ